MAIKEGAQVDTLPVQIYGWDGAPVRVGVVADAIKTASVDDSGATVNPASEESVLLLRRIVKLLESNAVVDRENRQKITLDTVTIGTVAVGVPVSGLSSGAGVPTTNYPTANAPIQQPGTANWQPCWIGPVDQRYQIMDAANLAYNLGIRSKLAFT